MTTVVSSTTASTTVNTTEFAASTTESDGSTTELAISTTELAVITTELTTITTKSDVDTSKKADSYLYVYIAIGVVVFFLIVILQTVCICLYKRKVAKSRRTLNYVLNSRAKEISDKKVRYSVGPVKKPVVKTAIPQNEDENVYESMERIAEAATTVPRAKSTPSPVRSPRTETINRSLRERPKLPLPHEIQTMQYEDMRGIGRPQTSTGVPLPHGMQFPRETVPHGMQFPRETLPYGMQSPRMDDMRDNPRGRPQTSTGVPLPHGMQFPRQTLPHGIQSPRGTLPHGMQSALMEGNNPQNTSFQPTASFPQPPASITRPRPMQTNAPIPSISRMHAEKLRTIHEESKRFGTDSSDEEWTYESLSPVEKYLT